MTANIIMCASSSSSSSSSSASSSYVGIIYRSKNRLKSDVFNYSLDISAQTWTLKSSSGGGTGTMLAGRAFQRRIAVGNTDPL